jgi:hypothetical protein
VFPRLARHELLKRQDRLHFLHAGGVGRQPAVVLSSKRAAVPMRFPPPQPWQFEFDKVCQVSDECLSCDRHSIAYETPQLCVMSIASCAIGIRSHRLDRP